MIFKNILAILAISTFFACSDVEEEEVSSSNRTSNVETTEATAGIITGKFKGDATGTQTLVASSKSNIADVALSAQPGVLAIDADVTLQEGSDRGSLLPEELGFGANAILGGSSAIHLDNSAGANPVGTLLLQIPVPLDQSSGSKLNLIASGKVGLLYNVRLNDGTFKIGLLILGEDNIVGTFMKMDIAGFGWFRLVVLTTAVDSKEVTTKTEPDAKS